METGSNKSQTKLPTVTSCNPNDLYSKSQNFDIIPLNQKHISQISTNFDQNSIQIKPKQSQTEADNIAAQQIHSSIATIFSEISATKNKNKFNEFDPYQNALSSGEYDHLFHTLINPFKLGFLPQDIAVDDDYTLDSLILSHFKSRSTRRVRVEHKLWNALCITKANPIMYKAVGIIWISSSIIKVNRTIFANLLGLAKPAAGLFYVQGIFPAHGFIELSTSQAEAEVDKSKLQDVDGNYVKLYKHQYDLFSIDSGVDELIEFCCNSPRPLEAQKIALQHKYTRK